MKKITIEDLETFQHLGALSVNASNTRALFLVSQAAPGENAYHHTLYEYSAGHLKKHISLKKASQFAWLDEETVLVPANKTDEDNADDQAGLHVFYQYHLVEQTFKTRHVFPVKPSFIDRVNDTLIVTLTLKESEWDLVDASKRQGILDAKKKNQAYEEITDMPYYFNGPGFVSGTRKVLATYDLKMQTLTRLTDFDFSVDTVRVDPDTKMIYYSGKPHQAMQDVRSNLYQVDLHTSTHTLLSESLTYMIKEIYLLAGTPIVAASLMDEYGMNQNPDFYTASSNGLQLLAEFRGSLSNTIGTDMRYLGAQKWTTLNDALYTVITVDDHSEILRLTKTGALTTFYQLEGSIDGLAAFEDGFLVIGMVGMDLQELYRFTESLLEPLSSFNHAFTTTHSVIHPTPLVVDKKTHEVKGWVLDPNPESTEKKPAILNVHGGPKTVYAPIYYHEMQVWANEGYCVMYANPRGSDGKGNAFSDIRGKYGTIDYEDLMDFVDEVIDQYNIDPKRLYVTGGSYGGFMTNWMVGHTNRFKAAVTQRSISNWISFYGTSDIGYFFASDQTAGHPLRDFDTLWEQSPLKYALNIQTPLLFIHSDKDYRCPIEQAQQLHAILLNEGVDTELIWFKDETHELSRSGKPEARKKRLRHISEWFKRYA